MTKMRIVIKGYKLEAIADNLYPLINKSSLFSLSTIVIVDTIYFGGVKVYDIRCFPKKFSFKQ